MKGFLKCRRMVLANLSFFKRLELRSFKLFDNSIRIFGPILFSNKIVCNKLMFANKDVSKSIKNSAQFIQ